MQLVFEWDDSKAKGNLTKHGVTFDEAKTIFGDPLVLTFPDDKHSDTEDRFISIGHSSRLRVLLVVHTEHDFGDELVIRIISSRRAKTAERRTYEEYST